MENELNALLNWMRKVDGFAMAYVHPFICGENCFAWYNNGNQYPFFLAVAKAGKAMGL